MNRIGLCTIPKSQQRYLSAQVLLLVFSCYSCYSFWFEVRVCCFVDASYRCQSVHIKMLCCSSTSKISAFCIHVACLHLKEMNDIDLDSGSQPMMGQQCARYIRCDVRSERTTSNNNRIQKMKKKKNRIEILSVPCARSLLRPICGCINLKFIVELMIISRDILS